MIAVDVAAKLIITTSRLDQSFGQIFRMQPTATHQWSDIVRWMRNSRADMELISLQKWIQASKLAVEEEKGGDVTAFQVLLGSSEVQELKSQIEFDPLDMKKCTEVQQTNKILENVHARPIDQAWIERWCTFIERL